MSDTWVYMLRCADGHYYVGSHRGQSPETRVHEHNAGQNKKAYTYSRRPVELVWSERFLKVVDAIATERQIKGWSRAKKEALINGNWDKISRLAKNNTEKANHSAE